MRRGGDVEINVMPLHAYKMDETTTTTVDRSPGQLAREEGPSKNRWSITREIVCRRRFYGFPSYLPNCREGRGRPSSDCSSLEIKNIPFAPFASYFVDDTNWLIVVSAEADINRTSSFTSRQPGEMS